MLAQPALGSTIQSNEIWRAQVEPLCPHLKGQYITYRLTGRPRPPAPATTSPVRSSNNDTS